MGAKKPGPVYDGRAVRPADIFVNEGAAVPAGVEDLRRRLHQVEAEKNGAD